MTDKLQKLDGSPSYIAAAREHFGAERFALLRETIGKDLTLEELALFLELAMSKRLDPFARQIHAVKRKQKKRVKKGGQWVDEWVEAMTIQTGIDGFRVIAQRTGQYEGQGGPFWCGDDGVWREVWLDTKKPPRAAKVEVFRKGFRNPLVGIALWDEYAQLREFDGVQKPMGLWGTHPSVMIAKCFDADTEVLTTRGFERFAEARGSVLQVTNRGLEATDAQPFSQHYRGEMVLLDSDDLNFCVTPNHDMVTTAGKIEAGAMFEAARVRPKHWIPRLVRGSRLDAPICDDDVRLSAILIADGWISSGTSWSVAVSRQRKIDMIESIGGWISRRLVPTAGDEALASSGRVITTRLDNHAFLFPLARVAFLVDDAKRPVMENILELSSRQARLFVDTLLSCDGSDNGAGVQRFYSSNDEVTRAFELACVVAGLSVSSRTRRQSDIGRSNDSLTVSERDEIPVRRWGRDHHGIDHGAKNEHTGLTKQQSTTDVWCVTVPSGVIVVRRNGFSMLCGNCAEAVALRRAFPEDLSGLYVGEEMKTEDVAEDLRARMAELDERLAAPAKTAEVKQLPTPAVREAELVPASEGMAAEVSNLERGEPEPPTADAPPRRSATAKLLELKRVVDSCATEKALTATMESWSRTIEKLPGQAEKIARGYVAARSAELRGEQIPDEHATLATQLNELAKE